MSSPVTGFKVTPVIRTPSLAELPANVIARCDLGDGGSVQLLRIPRGYEVLVDRSQGGRGRLLYGPDGERDAWEGFCSFTDPAWDN